MMYSGSEVVALLLILIVILCLAIAWKITMRRPLYYNLFLVEMHTWTTRRLVQVLYLGQEFHPRISWSALVTRMRSRAPQVEGQERLAISDTNVVIQSPSTVIDAPTTTYPESNSMTLWEIEIPPRTAGQPDPTRDSQYAAAAAIAVLARGINPSLSTNSHFEVEETGGDVQRPMADERGNEQRTSIASISVNVLAEEDGQETLVNESTELLSIEQIDSDGVTFTPESSASTSSSSYTATSDSFDELDLPPDEQGVGLFGGNVETNTPCRAAPERSHTVGVGVLFGLRLKFLDDSQREAHAVSSDTVADFKVKNFPDDVASGRVIRLIYQGQLLRDDTRSLESYGLTNGCVLHCHVSSAPYAQHEVVPNPPVEAEVRRRRPTEGAAQAPLQDNAHNGGAANNLHHEHGMLESFPFHTLWLAVLNTMFPVLPRAFARAMMGGPHDVDYRQAEGTGRPNIFWRAYRWLHNCILNAYGPTPTGPQNVNESADAAARPLPVFLNLGDYIIWIFAGQFIAVWLFVFYFPQVWDKTALALLILLSLYFVFVVCRHAPLRMGRNRERLFNFL